MRSGWRRRARTWSTWAGSRRARAPSRCGADEELRRVMPVIERLGQQARSPLSIDTSKAVVARAATDAGAVLVNDVTALRGDAGMAAVGGRVGRRGVPDAHARGAADHAGRSALRGRRVRGEGLPRGAAGVCGGRTASPRSASGSIPGSASARRSSTTSSCCGGWTRSWRSGAPWSWACPGSASSGASPAGPRPSALAGGVAANVLAFERGAHMFRVHDVAETRDALAVAAATVGDAADAARTRVT